MVQLDNRLRGELERYLWRASSSKAGFAEWPVSPKNIHGEGRTGSKTCSFHIAGWKQSSDGHYFSVIRIGTIFIDDTTIDHGPDEPLLKAICNGYKEQFGVPIRSPMKANANNNTANNVEQETAPETPVKKKEKKKYQGRLKK
ncbi:hypothetical protein HD806DRAFT_534466 [Xylariaceae sp. AK1471]|nr:hypothetical protein HD806DRAFT_534466 [Xylariaceae sp. AK1471]